jgi:hypothetical protein
VAGTGSGVSANVSANVAAGVSEGSGVLLGVGVRDGGVPVGSDVSIAVCVAAGLGDAERDGVMLGAGECSGTSVGVDVTVFRALLGVVTSSDWVAVGVHVLLAPGTTTAAVVALVGVATAVLTGVGVAGTMSILRMASCASREVCSAMMAPAFKPN